jgi:dihydrofolate synthase/folylpolyglutamate synthase
MKNISKQTQIKSATVTTQYSYNEIVEFLDAHWDPTYKDNSLTIFKQLDTFFGTLTQKINTIFITGSNGKSLTTYFTGRLLKEEGLNVGTICSPHVLTYNERITFNNEMISHKLFTDIGNEVLHAVKTLNLSPYSRDILTIMGLLFFKQQNVDVALIEATDVYGSDPALLCKPKIFAITRITDFDQTEKGAALFEKAVKQMLSGLSSENHVISADQSKINLNIMQKITVSYNATWAMPIRKLAPLPYPFEQLHGRSAALAERIAHIYVNNFLPLDTVIVSNSILIKQKGQRGRPTLEAKRQSELNPRRTIEQFWKDTLNTLPGRFQLLDKEKPTILLDNASNIDALQNVLLGIRLLHYHRPLKGLTLILGCNNEQLDMVELLKLLRYFFKKTFGNIIICPTESIPGHPVAPAFWNPENICNNLKSLKIKAKATKNFKEAFEIAQKSVDERHGLVVITGSCALVSEYWRFKGMKKIQ